MDEIQIGVKPSPITCSTAKSDKELITSFIDQGYNLILLPITNSKYRENCQTIFQKFTNSNSKQKNLNNLIVPSPNYQEVNLIIGDHLTHTIGLIASWIELESSDQVIAEFSNQILKNELSYAEYIGLKNIILAPPKDTNKLSNFSNFLMSSLMSFPNLNISISLPICEEPHYNNNSQTTKPVLDYLSTWDMWNTIRINCNYHENLSISLALPKTNIPEYVINRWFTEKILCLLISSSIFIKNNKNYPVFSKNNQFLIYKILSQLEKPFLLLHNIDKIVMEGGTNAYLNYLKYLIKLKPDLKIDPNKKNVENLIDLNDYPQFNVNHMYIKDQESDKIKYRAYQDAIIKAIKKTSSQRTNNTETINIAIIGTSGLLINKILEYANNSKTKLQVYIIEENLNLKIYLNKLNIEFWSNKIIFINAEKLTVEKLKFDIIISELIGFESPEVINNYEQFLTRGGIMIPEKIEISIAPSLCSKFYKEIDNFNDVSKFHKPYLINFNINIEKIDILSNKINKIWDFSFPNFCQEIYETDRYPLKPIKMNEFLNNSSEKEFIIREDTHQAATQPKQNKHNNRHTISTFKIHHKGIIHGIIVFSYIKLFDNVYITNNPQDLNYHPDLKNLKLVWLPLETPIYISDDTEIEICIRRISNPKQFINKVWNEWSLETFIYVINDGDDTDENQVRVRTSISKIHNSGGKHSSMEF